jgi:hypothetical protein
MNKPKEYKSLFGSVIANLNTSINASIETAIMIDAKNLVILK